MDFVIIIATISIADIMGVFSHSYSVESSSKIRNCLQDEIVLLQKEMMNLRKSRNFDKLEALEKEIDYLHRRMTALEE